MLDQANARSAYSKFDPYLFAPENFYKHGKNKAFERWGYTVDDTAWLQEEMDTVEVVVEKGKYAKEGVHKGMQGWICDPRCTRGGWLVNFPQYGEKDDIAEIDIQEEDLKEIPGMDAKVNERIREQFGE